MWSIHLFSLCDFIKLAYTRDLGPTNQKTSWFLRWEMRAGAKLGRSDLQIIVVADTFPVLGSPAWRFLHLGLVSRTLGSRGARGVAVHCPASGHSSPAHWRQEPGDFIWYIYVSTRQTGFCLLVLWVIQFTFLFPVYLLIWYSSHWEKLFLFFFPIIEVYIKN